MDINAAHSSLWRTSDVIFGGALLTGLALDYLVPLSFGNIVPAYIRIVLGGFVVLMGILIVTFAKVQFSKAKQPSAPGKPTTELVQHGIFHYSRNPLYLGLIIFLVGLSIEFNIAWWVILTGPVVALVQWALIVPEERYLTERFGDEYFVYASRVRRWI